jgi:serine/threonine protein phosphatase PrpC
MKAILSPKVKIKLSLPDIKYGHLKPQEDSYAMTDSVYCVAGGITRDPLSPLDFNDLPIEKLLEKYPNPSPAKMAADCFCKNFIQFLENKTATEDLMKKAFTFTNEKIKKLNQKLNPKPDYLINDFYACVVSGGIIHDNKLFWASIGDCWVMIVGKTGEIKFRSPNGLENFLNYIQDHQEKWSNPERRKEIRSQYRNNPNKIIDGKGVSYGALTGEGAAESFIKAGLQKLENGDLVVFYNDGFEKTLEAESFNNVLISNNKEKILKLDRKMAKSDYEKYGKERTLITVRFSSN